MTLNLFTGIVNGVETYVDDPKEVLRRKLRSPTDFWFDFFTSLPWSYLDYHSYQVHLMQARLSILQRNVCFRMQPGICSLP